jgi:MFS transporter, Spinster family, sphingosine-1-phosphate transporter
LPVQRSSQLVLALALTGFGVARATFDCTAMPLLCEIARPELRATGYGVFNGAGCIAGGVMATGAGWMKTTLGLTSSFYLAAAILLLSAIGVLWVPIAPRKLSVRQPILAVVNEPV